MILNWESAQFVDSSIRMRVLTQLYNLLRHEENNVFRTQYSKWLFDKFYNWRHISGINLCANFMPINISFQFILFPIHAFSIPYDISFVALANLVEWTLTRTVELTMDHRIQLRLKPWAVLQDWMQGESSIQKV